MSGCYGVPDLVLVETESEEPANCLVWGNLKRGGALNPSLGESGALVVKTGVAQFWGD